MHRIDNPAAAAAKPTPNPLGTPGYFTSGSPLTGAAPTIVDFDWLNTIQEELMNVISKGGLTPSKTNDAQLLTALSSLFNTQLIQITVTQSLLVPQWATRVYFRMCGGGGGGGHCQASGINFLCGGGGGSGAYAEAQRNVSAGALLTAIVGVGGGEETAGGSTSLAFPSNWTVTCGGGQPAQWPDPTNGAGGSGGVPTGGDLMSNGNFGGDGSAQGIYSPTGYGSPGPWGGSPRSGNATGLPGTGPGAGGSGAYDSNKSNTRYPGGHGANGVIQYRFMA